MEMQFRGEPRGTVNLQENGSSESVDLELDVTSGDDDVD